MKQTYQQEFIALKDNLSSFLYRLLTNKQDVEDVVQDTYIKVFSKIETFKEESSFKTWVFQIALNTAKNQLSKQNRWLVDAQNYGANLHQHSPEHWTKFVEVFNSTPEQQYEVKEHIAYCFTCINKTLRLEEQICLLLKEIYEFKIKEIVCITKLTEGKVKHAIADGRNHMIRIFDNRCSFVNKKGVCHQCTSLKGTLNPKQNAQEQALKIKMVKQGGSKDKSHLLNLRLELTKSIDPLNSPNSLLTTFMMESSEDWVKVGKEKKVLETRPKSLSHLSKI